MSRATIDIVPSDVPRAVELVKQARAHLASAGLEAVDSASSYSLAYQAIVKAMTAALLAVGRRATAGEAGHVVLLDEARRTLKIDTALGDRINLMRRQRNRVFYDARTISSAERSAATADAHTAIEMCAKYVLEQAKGG